MSTLVELDDAKALEAWRLGQGESNPAGPWFDEPAAAPLPVAMPTVVTIGGLPTKTCTLKCYED